jgi:hypothetical protein
MAWKYDSDTLQIREGTKSPFPLQKKKPGPLITTCWLNKTFISKTVCHQFWSGLMPVAQTVGQSVVQICWHIIVCILQILGLLETMDFCVVNFRHFAKQKLEK